MKLPKLTGLDIEGKRVIVRMDLDVDTLEISDKRKAISNNSDSRLKIGIPTLKYLAEQNAKVVIVGHRGRPGGVQDNRFSLKPVALELEKLLAKEIGAEKMK